jgi:ribosomal protein S18 acetylase RimI-like enzyme
MPQANLVFSSTVRDSDRQAVREIVESTGFFRPDEVDVAVELVDECLAKGPEASGYHFLFADLGPRAVGYACFGPIACTTHSYDLFWIAVHEDQRGQGLGKELLRRSEEAIARLGGRRVWIETSSTPKYDPTRGFYLSRGYIEEARLKEFYAPGDDKVVYSKTVGL